jgi:[protein-PII] uridylyltransferase
MTTAEKAHSSSAVLALAERAGRVDAAVIDTAAALPPCGASVLAVGGYGRSQLFPYSDVDVLILFDSEKSLAASKPATAAFLQQLWDFGLRVSHSVRTAAECLEVHDQNTELNISLLDHRFLAGDRALYAELAGRMPRFLKANRDSLTRNLATLARQRHARFANTIYHLEPNLKDAPGGLRDYQLIRWFEQLRQAEPAPDLYDGFRAIAQLRIFLHERSKRDNNVLSFEAQDALAELRYEGDAARAMRDYYRNARAIHRAALYAIEESEAHGSSLFSHFRDWRPRAENADFSIHRGRVGFRNPQQIETDPQLALRLFEFVARHGVRPSPEAERRLAARIQTLRQSVEEIADWPFFQRFLTPQFSPLALRCLHENGLLRAIFHELDGVDCLVIRDFYHRYTVDEHTLIAIEHAAAPAAPFQSLRSEIVDPSLLYFALLFHDSGKADESRGHVDASLELADTAMSRLRMPAAERETVRFLIGGHLELSAAMQSRDLSDPEVVRGIAGRAGTVERLKLLTLLTYADISAVNPEAMTPWRAAQLWQLYLAVYNELTRELENDRIGQETSTSLARAEFLEGLPTRYLRTHSEVEIERHMALDTARQLHGVAAEVRKLESAWQLTLLASDRHGLFASAAGALAGFGMNILRAEAFANRRGLVVDTFLFADPHRNLDLNPSEADRLRVSIERVASGKLDVRELLRNRPKPVPLSRKSTAPGLVSVNEESSAAATLIEIVAQDRPGLLYDLASAISSHGASIDVVLVDTEGQKAIDVFYVSVNGAKLEPAVRDRVAESLRLAIVPVS